MSLALPDDLEERATVRHEDVKRRRLNSVPGGGEGENVMGSLHSMRSMSGMHSMCSMRRRSLSGTDC